ncbi:helix-turn-helix domain-containing protein [Frigoriflavimonas asaccharolytica]|uniref:Transcriptional regulator with XRE-family HTH domain n=1 Tax=Frigoriflavimonas asaccharolytica TaxID=2735899 RepID=A0A8J8K4F2_9FLAO|nr:helix-turn-helix domain-containing protein [Frigoriflavimonas asaccharolytica]NRS91665.1 transcriptional regulator with XRE-family HTH domain [Frigoriflavimonas asaccharolytica]
MTDLVSDNIRTKREEIGYSQEDMAHKLDINQATYSKLERNSTKLTVDRLFHIAKLLNTEVADLLGLKTQTIFNQKENENAFGQIEHYYQENKEITAKLEESYETRLKEKDIEIAFLKSIIKK